MGSFTKKYMSAILPESLGLESIGSAYANFALSDDKQEDRAKIVCGSEKSAALAEIILNTQGLAAYEAYLEEICEKLGTDAMLLAKQKARRETRMTLLKKSGARAKVLMAKMSKAAVNALDVRLSPS